MAKNTTITRVAIYPGIGIARLGNSPEYFIGPETMGQPIPKGFDFKDPQGRVKKQAARFRIYGYNSDNEIVKEITADDAKITWRVEVANRKSIWYQFNNALDLEGLAIPSAVRNGSVTGDARKQLLIEPGPRSISGKNKSGDEYHFTGGKFYDIEVPLGQLRTDEQGRLLFLGADGKSASVDGAQAITFANNDGWHDDTADGPVRATVEFKGGRKLEAEPAMVAVTPPNFGPGLYSVVTMYDVVYDLFNRQQWLKAPEQPNFWENIYPVFERMTQAQWVNHGFFMLFGTNSPADFTTPEMIEQLSDPSPKNKTFREKIFRWLRNPSSTEPRPAEFPPYYGDAFGDYENLPNDELAITHTQYAWMQEWANGNFTVSKPRHYKSIEQVPLAEQPMALCRTNLEECLGGPFHPGIELTWPLRVATMWNQNDLFRPNIIAEGTSVRDDWGPLLAPKIVLAPDGPLAESGPGTLTRWLGVPWQTDEASCLSGYTPAYYLSLPSFWAARVPNQVLSSDSFKRLSDKKLNTAQRQKHFDYRQDWLRDLGSQYVTRINNMVAYWHQLGIITPVEQSQGEDSGLPSKSWVESGVNFRPKLDPTFLQVLKVENAEERAKLLLAAGPGPAAHQRKTYGRGER